MEHKENSIASSRVETNRTSKKIFLDTSPLMHCVTEEEEITSKSIPHLTRTSSTPISSRETTPTNSNNKAFISSSLRVKHFTPPLNRCFSITSYPSQKQFGCNLSPLSFSYLMQATKLNNKSNSCSAIESPAQYCENTLQQLNKYQRKFRKESRNSEEVDSSIERTNSKESDKSDSSNSFTDPSKQQNNNNKFNQQMTHPLPKPLPKPKLYTLSATTAAASPSVHNMRRERYLSRRTISDQGPNHQTTHLWGNGSPGMWGRRRDPKRTSAPSISQATTAQSQSHPINNGSPTVVSSPSSSGSNNSSAKYSLFVKNRRSWYTHQTPIYKRRLVLVMLISSI